MLVNFLKCLYSLLTAATFAFFVSIIITMIKEEARKQESPSEKLGLVLAFIILIIFLGVLAALWPLYPLILFIVELDEQLKKR